MTQQYLRNLSLVVADPAGKGIELGALRVTFEVRRGDLMTPNSCDLKVYNLSEDTANKVTNRLQKSEFTQLALKVSYGDPTQNPPQLIFRGTIVQARKGREDQKNSYVALTAADSDEAYNFSAVALTLAAGSTQASGISILIKQMATAAVNQTLTQGYTPQLTPNKSLRGRTYYGMTRDELRDIAANNDCTVSIQDGQLTFVPLTAFVPGAAVLITPYTGLINVPEQTQNGLEMTVLMNPSVKIGQLVKLDSSDVNQYRYGLDLESQKINALLALSTTKLNADGLYYVLKAEHTGDTRGTPWYTKLTCIAVDASQGLTTANQAAIFPGSLVPRN